MQINKTNYESFFLDYHEGNLPAELVAELFLFLEENPELKTEFESFENISLPAETLPVMEGKEFLKRGIINEQNYTLYFLKHVDGTLDLSEKKMVDVFLKSHPIFQVELALFEKTKLEPDLSIVYPDKGSLKKAVPLFGSSASWYYLAAAACILLLLGVFFMNKEKDNEPQTAERNSSVKESPLPPMPSDKNDSAIQNNQVPVQREMKGDIHAVIADHQKGEALPLAQVNQHSRNKKESTDLKKEFNLLNNFPNDEIALMHAKEISLNVHEQELVLAGQKTVQPRSAYYTLTAEPVASSEFPSVNEAIRDFSRNRIQQSIDDKPLASDLFSEQVPGKVKRIRFIGWCLQKVSGKRVDVQTTYSPLGELTAYHVSAGRLQFGKTFASR